MAGRIKTNPPEGMTLRGRTFSKRELNTVKRIVNRYFTRGRSYISREVCKALDWKQANGWLKDRACREALRRLETLRFLTLPPAKGKGAQSDHATPPKTSVSQSVALSPVTVYPKIVSFELAKGNDAEQTWNYLVKTYHYLGHTVTVGRCLKYLVKADGQIVGAISFSSSSWHLAARDRLLADVVGAGVIRDVVINNSRFLILPNVDVPNLASTVLSLATKRVVADWSGYYAITPQFVETFVESERFSGTCYKAANWVDIGTTKGYAKRGSSYRNSQKPKQIFLYGLSRKMRKKLWEASLKGGGNE